MKLFVPLTVSCLCLACETTPSQSTTNTQPASATPTTSLAAPANEARLSETAKATDAAALTLVSDVSQVCMVNNQFMGRPQIPVEVDGKTYFGCCEMCKNRLAENPEARAATDPVSGKPVDKATAVIARRPNGDVVYFENTANFERFRSL